MSMGKSVDLLLINKLVLQKPYNIDTHPAYSISPPNPQSTSVQNNHPHTCCLSYDESEVATLVAVDPPLPNLGLTLNRLSFPDPGQQHVCVITTYIPNITFYSISHIPF
jgi:hypothetical protein